MKKTLLALAAMAVAVGTMAKLPPPDEATKAKAAETAAKAAWQSKVDAYKLCQSQDKIAAKYGKHNGNRPSKGAMPVAAKPAASAASGAASAASGSAPTPAVASAPPPCADPGPFAYNPPDQKPLETSGAHSPSGTAANPPSVKPNSNEMGGKK